MFVRLALERDTAEIIAMGRANTEETCPEDEFSVTRAESVVRSYFDRADPTIFICDDRARVAGFLVAKMCLFDHRDGLYTTQRVLYVKPEYRGSRAATLLMKELVRWSVSLGAVAIDGGNDNGFRSERTRGFLEHFGFEFCGYSMRRRLGNGEEGLGRRRSGSG